MSMRGFAVLICLLTISGHYAMMPNHAFAQIVRPIPKVFEIGVCYCDRSLGILPTNWRVLCHLRETDLLTGTVTESWVSPEKGPVAVDFFHCFCGS